MGEGERHEADNTDEQMNRDIGTPTQGRFIGPGWDKSAPTGERFHLLNIVIGNYGWWGLGNIHEGMYANI